MFSQAQDKPLQPGEIHLWSINLATCMQNQAEYTAWLSDSALARAKRLPVDKRQWLVLSRGVLRHCLAAYLLQNPASLVFTRSATGKPSVIADQSLHFNLAHCGPRLVIVLRLDSPVGIDVEFIKPNPQHRHVAERLFALQEQDYLVQAVDSSDWQYRFFQVWTRKEAVIKALDGRLWQLGQAVPEGEINSTQVQSYYFVDGQSAYVTNRVRANVVIAIASAQSWQACIVMDPQLD